MQIFAPVYLLASSILVMNCCKIEGGSERQVNETNCFWLHCKTSVLVLRCSLRVQQNCRKRRALEYKFHVLGAEAPHMNGDTKASGIISFSLTKYLSTGGLVRIHEALHEFCRLLKLHCRLFSSGVVQRRCNQDAFVKPGPLSSFLRTFKAHV